MDNWLDDRLDRAFCKMMADRNRILRELLSNAPSKPIESGMDEDWQLVRRTTPEQFTIVTILDRLGHSVPVSEIAEQLDAPHANVSRTLDKLEKKGMVLRLRSKSDRRQVEIKLTILGKRLHTLLSEVKARFYKKMWDNFSDEEKVTLFDLLTR